MWGLLVVRGLSATGLSARCPHSLAHTVSFVCPTWRTPGTFKPWLSPQLCPIPADLCARHPSSWARIKSLNAHHRCFMGMCGGSHFKEPQEGSLCLIHPCVPTPSMEQDSGTTEVWVREPVQRPHSHCILVSGVCTESPKFTSSKRDAGWGQRKSQALWPVLHTQIPTRLAPAWPWHGSAPRLASGTLHRCRNMELSQGQTYVGRGLLSESLWPHFGRAFELPFPAELGFWMEWEHSLGRFSFLVSPCSPQRLMYVCFTHLPFSAAEAAQRAPPQRLKLE